MDESDFRLATPAWAIYLFVVPGAIAAGALLSRMYGESTARGIILGGWLALSAVVLTITYPKGYVFFAPSLAMPERRRASTIIGAILLLGFVVLFLLVPR